MNYSLLSPFFTRVSYLLLFVVFLGLIFYGLSAPFCYFILSALLFPIGVSMRLHRLNEIGSALTLTENTQWMVYIHGFPAQEQRAVLKNPCFYSVNRLRQFFIRCVVGKIMMVLTGMGILAHEFLYPKNEPVPLALACIVLSGLLYVMGKNLWLLARLINNRWESETLTTSTGSIWYQGFILTKRGREPMFNWL
ncbi:hypothetical protein CHU32_10615 [Superficieibacter electus]|uniref:Uncharacterized protein n=1 Tax=Superficieibacter electus TaxID=2022662 RepID=A0A2P5GR29_9ENTR|nr:hypothetical protein [Superficieibacter electus]POP42828.1 hypothetical protein CHU33_17980 [Superficieibacter electus]POP49033.1 hypothetical protein CHU32_10615 [Superficieibacter electus]